MPHNTKYFDHMYILNRLARSWSQKQFNEDDVMVLCAEVEREILADVEHMIKYEEIGIVVTNSILTIPCNLYRLLDVYDQSGNEITYQSNGTNLYGLKYASNASDVSEGTTLYINYRGTAIDLVTGIPLCLKGHEMVCETYCKVKLFEEDVAMGKFAPTMYTMWVQQLAGMITAAKQNYMHDSRADINRRTLIRGNMVPRIGNLPLSHNLFTQVTDNLTS